MAKLTKPETPKSQTRLRFIVTASIIVGLVIVVTCFSWFNKLNHELVAHRTLDNCETLFSDSKQLGDDSAESGQGSSISHTFTRWGTASNGADVWFCYASTKRMGSQIERLDSYWYSTESCVRVNLERNEDTDGSLPIYRQSGSGVNGKMLAGEEVDEIFVSICAAK